MKLFIFFALISIAVGASWITKEELEDSKSDSENEGMGRVAVPPPPNQQPGPLIVNPGGPRIPPPVVPVLPDPGNLNLVMSLFSPVTISVDPVSQLYVPPGSEGRIVILIRNEGIGDIFFVNGGDDKNFFVGFATNSIQLGPGQTIPIEGKIRVPVYGSGYSSTLTIIVQRRSDSAISQRRLYIRTKSEPYDRTGPYCTVDYVTKCDVYAQDSTCATRLWNYRARVQDTESGLLSVHLTPEGRFIGQDFIIGTNQSVPVDQTLTCCTSAVDIKATDMRGNSYTCRADQYSIYLGSGDIAAIVLGVLLFILLLVLLIACIVRCCKRRRSLKTAPPLRKHRDPQ